MYPRPICPICTRDWDERLGYCERCEDGNVGKVKGKKKKRKAAAPSDTPVYDRVVVELGFAPHDPEPSGRRRIPACDGMLEDNFS